MPIPAGTRLGSYEVIAQIGAGGMGEVYRARDPRLDRIVAIKTLPAPMAHDRERLARFQREARAVAALNHPNIVTIFSVEEADGVHFLTMELVEGLSLERHIPPDGLSADRVIEIGGAIAEALSAAHEKGIVHRDLKPANVMITDDNRVKVLDFGLAKAVAADPSAEATLAPFEQTGIGEVLGTLPYMSPEQISGRDVDHRTDIFSLGVLLHLLVTGRRPFGGTSSAELASAILRDPAPLVTELLPGFPSDLARIIQRCLEKDPRDRIQTARDVANEFRHLARRASANETEGARLGQGFWVAVLPFRYAGVGPDLAALADGLTEEIVTGLSRFSYLRVISRSSTARYAQQAVDVRIAAKELGARYVMEGSLRQAGSRLRIAVQLVDAGTGADLWAETYDRTFSPEALFELLDDVVPQIVATAADTQGVLPHSMTEALCKRDPETLSPYEAVLRSFAHFQRINAAEHAAARTALERAVQQAPGRADCWAMLSMLYREEYTHAVNVRPDPLGRSFAAARRAVEVEPSNHLAHHALASALFFRRELQAFRSAAERAIALNPMDGFTAAYLGMQIAYAGDWERGCALSAQARRLNPHHPGWYWFPPCVDAYRKRDYRGSLEVALRINMPGFWRTQLMFATTYGQLGEREQARNAVNELQLIRPNFAAAVREELGKWWDWDLSEHLIEGLRKAGLEINS
jgi:serine/threonine protein kinase